MKAEFHKFDGCTPMRKALEARPPAVLHATAWGLVVLLGVGIAWTALTPADLVVRADGRVRPTSPPVRVFAPAVGTNENRVARVCAQEGSTVSAGDVLLEFDTERLANEISRLQRVIDTGHEELTRMNQLSERLDEQLVAARSKIDTELTQARSEAERAELLQHSEIGVAEAEMAAARDNWSRIDFLAKKKVATEAERVEAAARFRSAERKLAMARTPLAQTRVEAIKRELEVALRDHRVRLAELEERRTAKQGEVDAAGKDLANLELQLRHTTVTSPIDGVVIKGQHHTGDLIEPGKVVFEVAAADQLCFETYVASEDVGRLRDAMNARIKFDAFDYQRYGTLPGQVTFIAPDSVTSADSLASMYVVRVGLPERRLVRGDLSGEVKLGMAGLAEIVTDRRTILQILVKRVRSAISLG